MSRFTSFYTLSLLVLSLILLNLAAAAPIATASNGDSTKPLSTLATLQASLVQLINDEGMLWTVEVLRTDTTTTTTTTAAAVVSEDDHHVEASGVEEWIPLGEAHAVAQSEEGGGVLRMPNLENHETDIDAIPESLSCEEYRGISLRYLVGRCFLDGVSVSEVGDVYMGYVVAFKRSKISKVNHHMRRKFANSRLGTGEETPEATVGEKEGSSTAASPLPQVRNTTAMLFGSEVALPEVGEEFDEYDHDGEHEEEGNVNDEKELHDQGAAKKTQQQQQKKKSSKAPSLALARVTIEEEYEQKYQQQTVSPASSQAKRGKSKKHSKKNVDIARAATSLSPSSSSSSFSTSYVLTLRFMPTSNATGIANIPAGLRIRGVSGIYRNQQARKGAVAKTAATSTLVSRWGYPVVFLGLLYGLLWAATAAVPRLSAWNNTKKGGAGAR